jgi:hypothetical protein
LKQNEGQQQGHIDLENMERDFLKKGVDFLKKVNSKFLFQAVEFFQPVR